MPNREDPEKFAWGKHPEPNYNPSRRRGVGAATGYRGYSSGVVSKRVGAKRIREWRVVRTMSARGWEKRQSVRDKQAAKRDYTRYSWQ